MAAVVDPGAPGSGEQEGPTQPLPTPALPQDPELARAIEDTQYQLSNMLASARKSLKNRATAIHPCLQPMGFKVLMLLFRSGPMHQSALVRGLEADKAMVSRLVKQLEELGLVSREADPGDGRAMLVDMTAAARGRYQETQLDARQLLVDKLSQWEPAEVRRLAELLARLTETTS